MSLAVNRFPLSTEAYHRMIDAGVFAAEDRVELIEGELLEMAPIGPSHCDSVRRFTNLLLGQLQGAAIVDIKSPLHMPPDSEPEPDVMLLTPPLDRYRHRKPEPADVIVLIEVADSSLRFDREVKLPLYARHGVPGFWLVNLTAGHFETWRRPADGAYQEYAIHRPGEPISPALLPALSLDPADFLGA